MVELGGRGDGLLGEPVEQRTHPLASAVYRLDVTHGVGLEFPGGGERAVPEQVGLRADASR
jgi:hypothetical protein